jgi:bifunctional DNA-binding transcriptional regulator/antitoxin component of YhaV-PrlF toxin-antitoxin module
MQATIDAAGRLILPTKILRQAGLRPGMSLEGRWLENRLEIEPAALTITLVRKGHLLVAIAQQEIESLSAETVEQTRKTGRSALLPDADRFAVFSLHAGGL